MKREKPRPAPDRTPAIVMSLLGAAAFGWGGISTLIDHTISWPARDGTPVRLTGSNADMLAWILLAAATACISHFAQALRPGVAGLKWTGSAFAVWAVAAATYYLAR
ncbi:hypothetical protein [Ramlibacter albus]|uniref:Uncharacterized protein n=1 Tax=Ramlibacter albus TaxID=2079448 RepID=A0A923MCH7_9BURK|nr:hypothetical protein [Ramlibacter albus]MBC5766532.1 hypothetical protein [Ramlibacter albus]